MFGFWCLVTPSVKAVKLQFPPSEWLMCKGEVAWYVHIAVRFIGARHPPPLLIVCILYINFLLFHLTHWEDGSCSVCQNWTASVFDMAKLWNPYLHIRYGLQNCEGKKVWIKLVFYPLQLTYRPTHTLALTFFGLDFGSFQVVTSCCTVLRTLLWCENAM
jgi:hypothetical protein